MTVRVSRPVAESRHHGIESFVSDGIRIDAISTLIDYAKRDAKNLESKGEVPHLGCVVYNLLVKSFVSMSTIFASLSRQALQPLIQAISTRFDYIPRSYVPIVFCTTSSVT